MNDLQELLATRDQRDAGAILFALREGLSADPADSGPAAPLHELLQGYFAIDAIAIDSSHRNAFRKHPEAARRLLAMVKEDGQEEVAQLMLSLIEGKPRPRGALKKGLEESARQAAGQSAGVRGAIQAFADVALATPHAAAELELSLGWQAVEEGLLQRVEQHAAHLAFRHGESHHKATDRDAALEALARQSDVGTLLRALAAARNPRVVARPGEWEIEHDGAPAADVEVPVRHVLRPGNASAGAKLPPGPGADQVRALYTVADGAMLFVPVSHRPREAGLQLIPAGMWEDEREHVMTWVAMGVDEDEIPDWAASVVPFAVLPGDAGRWVVVTEGPFGGSVMLAADDINEEYVRYKSLAHFLAALRLFPQEILGCGGYVRYAAGRGKHDLFPEGYREDA